MAVIFLMITIMSMTWVVFMMTEKGMTLDSYVLFVDKKGMTPSSFYMMTTLF